MTFVKGKSGNPTGRPKEGPEMQEIKALALAACPGAIKRIIELQQSDDPKVSLAAAKEVLDRGIGKPSQAVEVSGKDGTPLIPVINFGRKPQ